MAMGAFRNKRRGWLMFAWLPLGLVLTCMGGRAGGQASEIVETAVRANQDRFPHGRLTARYIVSQSAPVDINELTEVRTEWASEGVWCEARHWRSDRHKVDPDTSAEPDVVRYILTRDRFHVYTPGTKRVSVQRREKGRLPIAPLLIPATFWYSPLPFVLVEADWRGLLDERGAFLGHTDRHSNTWAVPTDGIVVLDSTESTSRGNMRIEFALADEGNVRSYEFREPSSGYEGSGANQWAHDPRGFTYLARASYVSRANVDGKSATIHYEYETLAFDPSFEPASDRFGIKGLELPNGTVISDQTTGRTYRVADQPVETIVDRLEPLIRLLRSRGFSRQGR